MHIKLQFHCSDSNIKNRVDEKKIVESFYLFVKCLAGSTCFDCLNMMLVFLQSHQQQPDASFGLARPR